MKFNGYLTEAILLKRTINFLAEVILPHNKQKLIIRCPNLDSMSGCDILGSRIWYSNATECNCLPTWELVEIDGGYLVCINKELIKPLVIEGIKKGVIDNLYDYNMLHINTHEQSNYPSLLLESDHEKCYLLLEEIMAGNASGEGIFPETHAFGLKKLQNLINIRKEGHRAVLFFCVMHNGLMSIKSSVYTDPEYSKLLKSAIEVGVELLAYRVSISLQCIELETRLPVLFSEDAIS